MKRRKAIKILRAALRDAMNIIRNERACDGCDTNGVEHEPACKYMSAYTRTAHMEPVKR